MFEVHAFSRSYAVCICEINANFFSHPSPLTPAIPSVRLSRTVTSNFHSEFMCK